MSTQEKSDRINRPGMYRDPESGAELEAKHHPKYGSAQADALVRLGWVRVGDAQTATQKVEKKESTK